MTLGQVVACSPAYATPCFPPASGPDYVNAALALETDLAAEVLLDCLHRIEERLGRQRGNRWGARAADIDLLAVGDLVRPDAAGYERWRALPPDRQAVETPQTLVLPHPRLHERAFVLVPLADIAPDWRHPVLGLTVAQMLAALPPGACADIRRLD